MQAWTVAFPEELHWNETLCNYQPIFPILTRWKVNEAVDDEWAEDIVL